MEIPKIKFGDHEITRLIMGGNPISGFSHISKEKDKEMIDYYTTSNIKQSLYECILNGINTFQSRGDRHIIRVLNEFRNEGGQIKWIAQNASELSDLRSNSKQIADAGAIGIYLHGTYLDNLWHSGKLGKEKVIDEIGIIKENGLRFGIGTHRPEIVDYFEENNIDVDFYLTSFYNLAKKIKPVQAIGGYVKEEFDDSDKFEMIKRINNTNKQCLVIKILGAGRKTQNLIEIKETINFALNNIKSNDAIIIGMYQKYKNQIMENSEIFKEYFNTKKNIVSI